MPTGRWDPCERLCSLGVIVGVRERGIHGIIARNRLVLCQLLIVQGELATNDAVIATDHSPYLAEQAPETGVADFDGDCGNTMMIYAK